MCTSVLSLRTKIVHACERERKKTLLYAHNTMTKSFRNDSGTNDAIAAGCLFGCHETLGAQIVLQQ